MALSILEVLYSYHCLQENLASSLVTTNLVYLSGDLITIYVSDSTKKNHKMSDRL